MTLRHVIVFLMALVVAVPAWACVPDPPTESVNGADASQASRIIPGVEDVVGRPSSIPSGMGGSQNIGTAGNSNSGTTGGNQTSDLTFTGATGTTQGTAVNNPNGSVTITPNGDTDFTAGTFENGREGRQIAPGTGNGRTSGGTIELNPGNGTDPQTNPVVNNDGSGRITFEGTGRVRNATTVEVNGGVAFIPGSPTIKVSPGRDRLDSNVVYGED